MIIRGFFVCSCGKLHCYGGMGLDSRCTCGRRLFEVWASGDARPLVDSGRSPERDG